MNVSHYMVNVLTTWIAAVDDVVGDLAVYLDQLMDGDKVWERGYMVVLPVPSVTVTVVS